MFFGNNETRSTGAKRNIRIEIPDLGYQAWNSRTTLKMATCFYFRRTTKRYFTARLLFFPLPNLFPPVRLFPVPVSIYDLSKHGDRLLVVERICITRERPTSVRDNERCTRSNRVPFLPRCLFFFITFRSRLWNVGPLKNRAKFS